MKGILCKKGSLKNSNLSFFTFSSSALILLKCKMGLLKFQKEKHNQKKHRRRNNRVTQTIY